MPEILERQASYSPRENRRVSKRGQRKTDETQYGQNVKTSWRFHFFRMNSYCHWTFSCIFILLFFFIIPSFFFFRCMISTLGSSVFIYRRNIKEKKTNRRRKEGKNQKKKRFKNNSSASQGKYKQCQPPLSSAVYTHRLGCYIFWSTRPIFGFSQFWVKHFLYRFH